VELGNSSLIKSGENIVVISSPIGLINTVTTGIVSYPTRNLGGNNLLQINASVYYGSSGGAVFNLKGEVVGVISNGLDNAPNINFAVPIDRVKQELESLI
jgi:S1-C subfamily serine protease